jgi:hypothetical protein
MVLVRLVPLRTQRSLNKRGSIRGHGAGLTTYAADPVQDEEALRRGSIALPSLSSNASSEIIQRCGFLKDVSRFF